MTRSILIVLLSLCSLCLNAGELSGRADISYSEANPDYSPFSNGEGVSLFARVNYQYKWFLYARHSTANFKPSGQVSGAEVELWQEAGLGYRRGLSELWSIEANVSYQRVEQANNDETGDQVQLGANFQPTETLGFSLHLGKLDLQIDDWTLMFEADYSVTDDIYLVARLRDYADWDFTYYEAGVGLRF